MSSIFTGQTGLRHQFEKLAFGDLAGTTNATNAKLLARLRQETRLNFIDNTTDKDLVILLVHPKADPTVAANRLFWIEIPSLRVLNYDVGAAPGLHFDPGTRMYVYALGGNPATGALRLSMWG